MARLFYGNCYVKDGTVIKNIDLDDLPLVEVELMKVKTCVPHNIKINWLKTTLGNSVDCRHFTNL